jgi:hypothetical protein
VGVAIKMILLHTEANVKAVELKLAKAEMQVAVESSR